MYMYVYEYVFIYIYLSTSYCKIPLKDVAEVLVLSLFWNEAIG